MNETILMNKTEELNLVSRECNDGLFLFVNECLSFGHQSRNKRSLLKTVTRTHYNTKRHMFLKLFDIFENI